MQKETLHPCDIAKEVLEVMAPHAREKGITLEGEWGESLPPIFANHDLLCQAVTNLVSNAIKYTSEAGHVRVCTSVDEENERYVITVIDNGVGIGAEDLPRVFDKFYRTAQGSATATGTGLGLNLVRQIVETVHHGDISVTSERDVGTTVVVRLPIMTG
jgi:signal transduction histidine kinase